MIKKTTLKPFLLIFLLFLFLLVFFLLSENDIFNRKELETEKEENILVGEEKNRCTNYTDQEYGFSFCYPFGWQLPEEKEILPPQQWLYNLKLRSVNEVYEINLYDQMLPNTLSNFIRDYFSSVGSGPVDVFEREINGQRAVGYFFVKESLSPTASINVGFQKGTRILIISSPEEPLSEKENLFNKVDFKTIIESFNWVEE